MTDPQGQGKHGDREALRRLAASARGERGTLPILVVLGLAAALTEGLGIALMIPVFTALFAQGEAGAGWLTQLGEIGHGLGEGQRVALLVGLILTLAILRAGVIVAHELVSIRASGRVTHRLRLDLFRTLLAADYAAIAARDRGRLFDVIRGETWLVGELLMTLSRGLVSLCVIFVFGILLVAISPHLTLAAAVGGVAISLIVRLVARRTRRLAEATVATGAALTRHTIEALASLRTIRMFERQTAEREKFAGVSEADRLAAEHVERAGAMIQPAAELLYAPLFLGLLLSAYISGMDLPTLVAFMVLLYRLQPHARRLDQIRVELAGNLPILRQITGLLALEPVPSKSTGRAFRGLAREIRFAAVGFSYPGSAAAVTNLSFSIPKNRVTAIVGESGAGKTTVVNLLFRLYDPHEGAILADGVPLTDLDLGDWRARLAFAGQDAELIGETVHDAIAFGRAGATRAQVEAAAVKAHAAAFIAALPRGFDTPLKDAGSELSAGQRQRIGLARALVREPEILVLDEATSALDAVSENAIQQTLDMLSRTLTLVVIAHRLSTVRDADQVIVLRDGRVVETGSPSELAGRDGGAFAEFWKLQSLARDGA
ncbi:MAG TPA: ABC transporter ATP-binding protein [Saliniramus sp.]|nr:ABC transporter ATP-binding protein [Saliniramus sp.]